MRWYGLIAMGLLVCLAAAGQGEKIVIAHRGASGYVPEHTLEAYAVAHAQGADYIEPDVVLTKDGRFICLHDIHLEGTTNVEQVFPDRKREDGKWYAADFTLDEIKQLRVHERLPNRFPKDLSKFEVPTFEEMIELVQGLNKTTGREAGIYPELKQPGWHTQNGLPMEEAFLDLVARYGYSGPDARIFVQCFEPKPLQRMRELGSQLPQIMLVGGGEASRALLTEEGLKSVAGFANGIGPDRSVLPADPEIVTRAHANGLAVHPYTFRADFVVGEFKTFENELRHFYVELGVDAVFTDFPDKAVAFLRSEGLR